MFEKVKKEICRLNHGKMTEEEKKHCLINCAGGSMEDIRGYYDSPTIRCVLQFIMKVFRSVRIMNAITITITITIK